MLLSMTGFGAAAGQVDGVEYAVEIRSVNNRYYKSSIKLPEDLAGVEPEVERLVRESVSRGSVTVSVRMRLGDEQAAGEINVVALNKYLDQLRMVETEANPTLRIDLASLLLLPGVCNAPAVSDIAERTTDGLLALVKKAIAALMTMRQKEGQALAKDLHANCDVIGAQLVIVKRRSPNVVAEYQLRLAARVQELTRAGQVEIDQSMLAREVAIFAERSDINEEISRLTGHVEQFRLAVDGGEPAGRKLDFIAQEMLREANTIASKANDGEIARAAVEMKTAIDRIKEQVQNAE
ncbi:MAG: YicC family protein [Planctomycetota bacterium]|nr:YicC family protein [Planctomycetota bacterium]